MPGWCGRGTRGRGYGDPRRCPAGTGGGARDGWSGVGGFAVAGHQADRVRVLDCGKPAVDSVRVGTGERLHDDSLRVLLGHSSTGPDERTRAGGYGSVHTVELKDAERYPLNISLEQNAISLPPSPDAARYKPLTSMRFGLNLIPIAANNPAGINQH